MARRIYLDPVTRLEGHGQIEIRLDQQGRVQGARFKMTDFRGFEKLCQGRAVEEMPTLTQKICGVCPTAHHIAGSKALDDLYGVQPPPAAARLREMMHHCFIFEDHLLHFYFLGGPDLLLGPGTPAGQRNIFGLAQRLGAERIKRVMGLREKVRGIIGLIGGSALYPVCGLPGGVSRALPAEQVPHLQDVAGQAVELAGQTLELFKQQVLGEARFAELLDSPAFSQATHYLGLVDDQDRLSLYDGQLRVVDPQGRQVARFPARDYDQYLQEMVEPWSFAKTMYLKSPGWQGYREGPQSGVYRVGPLARLNAAQGMATPLAQEQYEQMYQALGGRPAHQTLAFHWARLIEVMYAAERMSQLAGDPELAGEHIRNLPQQAPGEGVGVCEAPRGTLIHHYQSDAQGLVTRAELLVATQHNAAAITMSVEKAARALIKGEPADPEALHKVEMAYRAYDPCVACATHCLELT